MEINEIEILSVGVDVGSSTSHLVFSNLVLKRDQHSVTRRFNIQERKVIYEGRILHTPFLDNNTIDISRLTEFFKEEYELAGIDPADIQTGAVIVTGESARKQNARQIAEGLSKDGAATRSRDESKTILSCDIGGGTSNIAISKNGEIISTSCVSVGGRLLGVDSTGKIWRIDEPAARVMKELGLKHEIGDPISKTDVEKIAATLTEILFEVITGPATSSLARQLMLTPDLKFTARIDEYSFSGGVAELMYGGLNNFNDIGHILADKIKLSATGLSAPVMELPNKIRATVIGAGAYSLSISGCSGFRDDKIAFPVRNVPVVRVDVDSSKLSGEHLISQINVAFQRFDFKEGDEIVALYFEDPVRASYPQLELFAKSIEKALANTIKHKLPVILIFETDIACSVGNVIRRETQLKTNLLSLDELMLKEGDWIDIGEPLVGGQVFPVTVKSLVFH
jgi:ethanolamine utilization protein EutA